VDIGENVGVQATSVSSVRTQAVSCLPQLAGIFQWRHQFLLSYPSHCQLFTGWLLKIIHLQELFDYLSNGRCL
jgi:hypothetical protein